MECLNDRNAPAADPAKLPRRGTEVLRLQAHCPFRAFMQLRLGAEKLESPEIGVDRRVRGGLVETALEAFWMQVRHSDNLNGGLPQPDINAAITAAVDKAFEECLPNAGDSWDQRMRGVERRRLHRLLTEWLAVERSRTDFEVMEHQKEFKTQIGPLEIHGYIDRLDRVRGEGYVVIDYKSGRTPPSPKDWDSDRPEEPQLPLYAVQVSQEHELSGIAFAHVSAADLAFKGCATRKEILGLKQDTLKRYFNGRTIAGQVAQWRPTLAQLAERFVAGEADVDPKNPPTGGKSKSTCDRCHLQGVCRVAEMTFAAVGGEQNGGDDE
jgi:ATP-dependent helicase/DNAse subunit B